MPAVRQRKEDALGSQRRAVTQDCFKPIVHEPGVGLGKTQRGGGLVQGRIVGEPAPFVSLAIGFPAAGL